MLFKQKVIIMTFILLILLLASLLFYLLSKNSLKFKEKVHETKIETQNTITKKQLQLQTNIIAIYGIDERGSETSRSDVIMIVKYNPNENKALLISIPRDSRVNIPGKKVDKINHAYAFGGPELLTLTLEELFEIQINYYVKFNFEQFISIIDEIGGIHVNAKKDYGYDEIIIPEGNNILDGEQALFYVRFRKDEEGDLGRIKRQQEVINSLLTGLKDKSQDEMITLLTNTYKDKLETNIDLNQLLNYYEAFNTSLEISIDSHTLDIKPQIIDGIYYGEINQVNLEDLKMMMEQ